MNNHQLGSQIRQSDEIMRKLNQIKNAIDGRRQFSPNNLVDYLPNQRNQRLTSQSQNPQRLDTASNPQSYRYSLEKKLQRLFKQEKKIFHQNQAFTKIQTQPLSHFQSFIKHDNRDVFTIQKMQSKIKQLERKYLHSNLNSDQKQKKEVQYAHQPQVKHKKSKTLKLIEEQNVNNDKYSNKKNKSVYEKQVKETGVERSVKKQRIEQKSEKKLLNQIGALKKQIKWIKQTNAEINQRIQNKEQQKKEKRQRSRYLLKCILTKLIQIQQQIKRREKKQMGSYQNNEQTKLKNTFDERQSLKIENTRLINQVEQLNLQLKKQANQKKLAQQRNKWVQNQLRKFSKS